MGSMVIRNFPAGLRISRVFTATGSIRPSSLKPLESSTWSAVTSRWVSPGVPLRISIRASVKDSAVRVWVVMVCIPSLGVVGGGCLQDKTYMGGSRRDKEEKRRRGGYPPPPRSEPDRADQVRFVDLAGRHPERPFSRLRPFHQVEADGPIVRKSTLRNRFSPG